MEVQLTSACSAGPAPPPQEGVGIFGRLAWQDRVIDITFMSDSLANQPPTPQASESFSDITQFQADVISSLSSQSDFSMLHAHPTLLDCDHTVREKLLYTKHYFPMPPGLPCFTGKRSRTPGGPQGPCLFSPLSFCSFIPAFQLSLDTSPTSGPRLMLSYA